MGTQVLVVFYSMTGRTARLAQAIAKGAEDQSASVRLRRVKEQFSEEMFARHPQHLRVAEELKSIPEASHDDIFWADGIAFGSPTRFGAVSNQMQTFLQSLEELAAPARFEEKIVSAFTSTTRNFGGECSAVPVLVSLVSMGFNLMGHQPIIAQEVIELFKCNPLEEPVPPAEENVEDLTEKDLESARVLGQRLAFTAARMKIRENIKEAA